ncbi:hypothetical protein DFJ74DRAFT_703470 [Hyaloraphidium curvatum]|nr:hypothetical protein DFJ74DRAFT_703470 [Hyaloraphidium curvatum]
MEVDEEANLGQGRKSTLGRGKAKSSEPVEIEDSEDGAASGRAGHQKVARHQYARLSSALHTAEEKPDYDPNTVTGSPASPVVYFEAGDMKSMGFKLFSILPEESRSRLTNLLPEYEREKLKASSVLADKAAVNETLRGLVEKFRAIQLRDRAAGDKRGAYSAEDAPTPEYDEDADKAALDAYRRFAAEHADTPVPPEALRKLFESNLFLQTDFDIWRNEIAVGHMAPAFLAGFEKWAEEKEHTTSQKDQHFEAWWGEKADRTKLVAGASREITLLMLIKRKLVLAGDRLVFRRNFSLIKKEIERTVEIERVDAASGVTIRMLPGREGQEGSASSAGSRIEKLDAPTAIEHAILDADGRVGREQRPNGNAWKCLKLLRRDGGGTWIDLGTLWHVRLDEWERKTGQVNSREAAAAAKDGNSTRNKGKGK